MNELIETFKEIIYKDGAVLGTYYENEFNKENDFLSTKMIELVSLCANDISTDNIFPLIDENYISDAFSIGYGNKYYNNGILHAKFLIDYRNFYNTNTSKLYIHHSDVIDVITQDIYGKFISQKIFSSNENSYVDVSQKYISDRNIFIDKALYLNKSAVKQLTSTDNLFHFCRYEYFDKSKDININNFFFLPVQIQENEMNNDIMVLNLETVTIEELDLSNYNDDTRLASCYFVIEGVKTLLKYTIFAGNSAYFKEQNSYEYFGIDFIGNEYFSISEGEFNNKLPDHIKKELLQFNVREIFSPPYMSHAVYKNHIEGKWLEDSDYDLLELYTLKIFDKFGLDFIVENQITTYIFDTDFEILKRDCSIMFPGYIIDKKARMDETFEILISDLFEE